MLPNVCHLMIILGISGDLARKKIVPTLWNLHNKDLLPANTYVIGVARSALTSQSLYDKVTPYVTLRNETERAKYELFWQQRVSYFRTKSSTNASEYHRLNQKLQEIETQFESCNRLFYFALPPHIYADVAKAVHNTSMSQSGWTRIVIEKPFGHDLESSNQLSAELNKLFTEDQIYRIDHYLGKEMVQNILAFRFGNQIYEPLWNDNYIEVVEILFKESFGAYGRGAYFDKNGIIRDVVQNHLLQVLTLIAMEEPVSLMADDVRNQKVIQFNANLSLITDVMCLGCACQVRLLKAVRTLRLDDVVLGQYVANPLSGPDEESSKGYLDDKTVSPNSTAATYSLTVHHIDNSRWKSTPFIIRAGKALDSNQIEVRIFFKTSPNLFSQNDYSEDPQNVLIMRIQPNEAIIQRIRLKRPGLNEDLLESNMDLFYSKKFQNVDIPDAYEKLILDICQSNQVNFVRTDELSEAWRIFTPVLHQIDNDRIPPFRYVFGDSSLKEADQHLKRLGLNNLV